MKKKDIIYIILLILSIVTILSVTILQKELNNLDEIWNYNISKNFAEGKLPYKDFNFVQMPGFFIMVSLFLRVSNQLIIMRMLAIILCSGIVFLVYKILLEYKINKSIAYFLSIGIAWIYMEYFALDYNFLNLFITLLMIYIEKKNIGNNSKKYNIAMGILAGFSFIVKQTTGAAIILAFLLTKLLEINKKQLKEILKTVFLRCIGISIPIIVFMIYLTINNIWSDFINYTILALPTFNNKLPYVGLLASSKILIKIFSIVVPAYFIGLTVECILKKDKKYINLLCYGLASFIIIFPISDDVHFLIGSMPALIGIICVASELIGKLANKKINEEIIKILSRLLRIITCTIIIAIIMLKGWELINICNENLKFNQLEHFKYIPISKNLENIINNVSEYVLKNEKLGRQTYILEGEACIYMIPINKYNKDYDMFLKGNLGKAGEEGQIEKIKKLENANILIFHNPEARNWQTPTKVLNYVETNLTKVGSISNFDIYATQESQFRK